MSLSVQQLIIDSLRLCGAVAKSEVPTADEMQDGLRSFNKMLGLMSARRLIVRATSQISTVLTAGKATYTVGATGEIVAAKPIAITSGFIRDNTNSDTPLDIIRREEFDNYGDKAISTSRPIAVCYDPGSAQQASQVGTLLFYYTPDSSMTYTAYLQVQAVFTQFTSLSDTITFEDQYDEPLTYELARRLWREYHDSQQPIPTDILTIAAQGMCVLEKTNHVIPVAGMEIPPKRSVFNIYTGENS